MMCPSLLLLLITAALASVADCYCPQQNHTGELKFTKKLGRVDYVRVSHSIAILCCAEGYENISWYRNESDIWVSFPPSSHGDDNTPKLEEDGQILRIYDAVLTDKTSYRCDVKGKRKIIQHITDLIVIECDPLARGPIPTSPFPENHTIYDYGGNITLHCTGYFGCSDPGSIQLVLWMVNGKRAREVSPRYKVQTSHNKEQFVRQAKLTITSVQEEDTKKKFSCILATPEQIHGQTITNVYISKNDKPDVPTPWVIIGLISGGCALFVLKVTVFLCLRKRYGPQIRLFCSSRVPSLGPRYIDNENYIYNVFIYHAEEDEKTALDVKKELTDRNYNVYITADIEGGQSIINTLSEKTDKSALVFFLYSEALKKDHLANLLLQSFIRERRGKDIMFLEVTDYKPNEIMNWAKHAKDTDKLNEIVAQQKEAVHCGKETNGVDVVTETDRETFTDLRFWKVLPRYKVPSEDSNKRKKDYFWCSLQNKIPKFASKREPPGRNKDIERKHRSSQKCVIETNSVTEPLIPLTHSTNADELIPNIKEELSFGVSNTNERNMSQTSSRKTAQAVESCERETVEKSNCKNHENDLILSKTENWKPAQFGDVRVEIYQDSMAQVENRVMDRTDEQNGHKYINLEHCNDESSSYVTGNPKANSNDVLDDVQEATEMKNKAGVIIDNVQETRSFGKWRGINTFSEVGSTNYTSFEGDESCSHDVLSNKSSGISENDSEVPVSCQGNAYGFSDAKPSANNIDNRSFTEKNSNGNGKLNLKIHSTSGVRNQSSSSPESGYVTSPSERSNSLGTFLPQIKEHVERGFDVVLADKAISGRESVN